MSPTLIGSVLRAGSRAFLARARDFRADLQKTLTRTITTSTQATCPCISRIASPYVSLNIVDLPEPWHSL